MVSSDADWRERAACAGLGPELFFPAGEECEEAVAQIEQAKAVCAGCPVRVRCLAFALATRQEYGIWGGRSEAELRAIRRQRRAGVGRRTDRRTS